MSEELKDMKKRLMSIVQNAIDGNIDCLDTNELGEAIDMIKDLSESIYYCSVVNAMENSSSEEQKYYMSMYAPETQSRYYTVPRYYDSEYKRDLDRVARGRMYFTEPHNVHDGRSYMSRRTYMEAKELGRDSSQEMESYMTDLANDLTEMINEMTPTEKSTLKQKLSTLVSKI